MAVDECDCADVAPWDGASLCVLNCNAVANYNSSGTADATTCPCNTGFLWNPDLLICGLDCSGFTDDNKDGDIGISDTECKCMTGFLWNTVVNLCGKDCSEVVDANKNGSAGISPT